jgi:hypothetical protein
MHLLTCNKYGTHGCMVDVLTMKWHTPISLGKNMLTWAKPTLDQNWCHIVVFYKVILFKAHWGVSRSIFYPYNNGFRLLISICINIYDHVVRQFGQVTLVDFWSFPTWTSPMLESLHMDFFGGHFVFKWFKGT